MDEHEKAKAVVEGLDFSDDIQCTSLTERLRLAHADAVSQIERDRNQPGQLTTGINGEVAASILNAGMLALTEEGGGHSPFAAPKQFVVAAPPGTGKTSHTVALMAAIVRTADPHDPLQRPKKPKRVALYLRVSTSEQTTRNQRRELHAVAERHGWHVVATYEDAGVSGANGRDKRPGFDRLMTAVARREIDMVAAWSVDRLGRSLTDLLSFLTDLHAKGVDLFLHQQGLDTSTPSGRAMFQMLGVFAEFERAMIRERVMAGLARARAEGKQLGRRSVEQSHAKKVKAALALRSKGLGIRRISREVGLGVGTVIRLVGKEAEVRRV